MDREQLRNEAAGVHCASWWCGDNAADCSRSVGRSSGFGVGIAQGHATLGRIGSRGRFDYAAIGTVVNLAARMWSEAVNGQILIDPKVQAAVESVADTEPAGEFMLKGLHRPVTTFNVRAVGQ